MSGSLSPTGRFIAVRYAGMQSGLAENKGVQDGQRQGKRQRGCQGRKGWQQRRCQRRKARRQPQFSQPHRKTIGWWQGQQSSKVQIGLQTARRMHKLPLATANLGNEPSWFWNRSRYLTLRNAQTQSAARPERAITAWPVPQSGFPQGHNRGEQTGAWAIGGRWHHLKLRVPAARAVWPRRKAADFGHEAGTFEHHTNRQTNNVLQVFNSLAAVITDFLELTLMLWPRPNGSWGQQ